MVKSVPFDLRDCTEVVQLSLDYQKIGFEELLSRQIDVGWSNLVRASWVYERRITDPLGWCVSTEQILQSRRIYPDSHLPPILLHGYSFQVYFPTSE
jgi:hypothetical protein